MRSLSFLGALWVAALMAALPWTDSARGQDRQDRSIDSLLPPGVSRISSMTFLNAPDGSEMVLIRPPAERFYSVQSRLRTPIGPAQTFDRTFLIGTKEISRAQYRGYLKATARGDSSAPDADTNLPQVNLTLADVLGYCAWAQARIPTHAEWEFAACGPRTAPWGDLPPRGNLLNSADQSTQNRDVDPWVDGYEGLAPVDAFPDGRSPFGLFQPFGNAAEIVFEFEGSVDGRDVGVVGGSFADRIGGGRDLRVAVLAAPLPSHRVGFRIARALLEPK